MAQQQLHVGAIGIDIGSQRSVIAVVRKGGVEIIRNEGSNYETQNIVAYREKERFMGEQAVQQAKGNFKNTVSFFTRLLGLPSDYPPALLRQETKWISSKVGRNQEGKIVSEIQYNGENLQLLPEQTTACMITKLKQIINHNNLSNKEAVISVPSYYTESERKALLQACKIADLRVVRLLNETSAISLSYGLFRKGELGDVNNPRNVIFVDFGHSKLSAFIGTFTKENCKVMAQVHERNLGIRDIDWLLLQKYAQMFEKSSGGLDIFESKKAQMRLLDAIEKQRKVIASVPEASINVECVMEEYDLNYLMTREEFDKIAQEVIDKIATTLQILQTEITEKQIKIHSVEIIGGGTRIPVIKSIIQKVFQVEQLNTTLHATEVVARGSAMMGAIILPYFNVTKYQLEESNYYPIKTHWTFQKSQKQNGMEEEQAQNEEKKHATLFDYGCSIPNIKSLTFKQTDQITVSLNYEPGPLGFQPHIAAYVIPPRQPKEKDFHTKIRIKLTEDGLITLGETQLIEEYQVEEKVKKEKKKEEAPKVQEPAQQQQQQQNQGGQQMETENKPPQSDQQQPQQQQQEPQQQQGSQDQQNQNSKPEEEEYEIKIKKKTRSTNLNCTEQKVQDLSQKQIDSFFQLECDQSNQDKQIQELIQKRNDVETYVYKFREKINNEYKNYCDPKKLPEIMEALARVESWLYDSSGKNAAKKEYIQQLDDLKRLCESTRERYIKYEALPQAFQELEQSLQKYDLFVNSQEPQYEHIPADKRQIIFDESNKIRAWFQSKQPQIQNLKSYDDPIITAADIENRLKQLKDIAQPIINTPKPEPPKVEKQETNKMQEENNANQQQNQQSNNQQQNGNNNQQQNNNNNQQPQTQNKNDMEVE